MKKVRRCFFLKSILVVASFFLAGNIVSYSQVAGDIPEDVLDAEQTLQSTLTLVSPFNEPPVVVVGVQASPSERYAAQELAGHLAKITKQKIGVVTEDKKPEIGKFIAVGKSALTTEYDIESLGIEQYIIDVKSNGLVIVGGRKPPVTNADGRIYANDRGTLYGVYEFLERLGVRWYRPEPWGWHIPQTETIELPVGKTVSRPPAFIGRNGMRFSNDITDAKQRKAMFDWTNAWNARQRATERNYSPGTPENLIYGGSLLPGLSHSHTKKIITPEKYLKTHPEYFALVNGQRGNPGSGRTPQLCLGNPQLQEEFAKNVVADARDNPQKYSIGVDPEDGTQLGRRMCTCPLCIAMDDPKNPQLMSNRVFAFTNIIARKVAQQLPGTKIGLFAYSSHTPVPTLFDKLEPNIIVAPCNINAWTDWTKKMQDSKSPQNARYMKLLKEWQAFSPHKLWAYDYDPYGWPGPVPMYRLLQDRAQTYRDMNVEGMIWPAQPNWGPQLLLIYLKLQLQWNPDLDLDKELDLYYSNYFGPAAAPMKAYYERWMNAFETSQIGTGLQGGIASGGRGMHVLNTPKLIDELGNYIEQAQKAVQGNALYERRLRGEVAGYEFARRVSEIVSLKVKHGKPVTKPGASASYLQTPLAEQKWEELLQWMKSTNEKELTFDIKVNGDKVSAVGLTYLKRDLLENNRYSTWDEKALLTRQGF